jgi:putative ABC transport system permease protein
MGHDLRFALRSILTHPWFSAAVVLTVAMGIGVNTMVFTLVNAVLLKPLAVPHGERIVVLSNSNLAQNDDSMRISYPDFLDYRSQVSSVEAMEAASDVQAVLSERGNPPAPYHMEHATAGLFDMLHIRPILGRGFLPTDDKPGAPPVLLLGYGIWKDRYSSSPSVIGRTVRENDTQATIIGVMPEGFKFPVSTDLWMPLTPTPGLEKRDSRPLEVWAMLKSGVGLQQASVECNEIASRLATQYPEADKDRGIRVQTFNRRYNGSNIRTVFFLMLAAVGFVLLIACANVANMMLTRALGRQREMSIRAALGASRWRVIREQLTESLILSVLGGVLGLGLAALGVHWFDLSTQDVGKPYWIQFTMDLKVFGYFAALCIVSGLLFGIAPAWRASRVNLIEVLKEGARSMGKHRGGKLAAAMVIFQFALTLVLLTGAGVFIHHLILTLTANRSIPGDQLMTAHIDFPDSHYKDTDSRQHFFDQLLPRLRSLPGVTHVAAASNLPGLGSGQRDLEIEHSVIEAKSSRPRVSMVVQSPGYFDTIHLPLLLGRDFNETDGADGHKAAVLTKQCAARFWPNQSAIGKRFRFYDDSDKPGDWITVIGVSADMIQDLNDKNPQPLLFLPFRQEGWNGMDLIIESSVDVTGGLRAAVASIDEDLPLRDVSILNKAIEHQEWFFTLLTQMFTGFALIALLMASVGLYAVIAHATGSRTQEIGVRMALGANTSNIMMLVMKRGLWQIGAGLALGLGAAFPATRMMASLPIGVAPSDPAVFVAVASVLVAVGLFACWLPARKAAALDPVKAIRVE